MGLFSKPSEDKVVDMFNALSDTEKESVKTKLFGVAQDTTDQTATDIVAQATEEPVENNVDNTDNVDKSTQTVDNSDEESAKNKESFEDMLKRLMEENKKEIESLKEEVQKQFEELSKKPTEINAEKKPFGLTENSKEYKSNVKPKETSKEMVKRLFGGGN